jgi:two-component system, sensor histidine kinase and response regulator
MSVSQVLSLNLSVSEASLPKLVSIYQRLADLANCDAFWLTEKDLQPLTGEGKNKEWLCLLLSGDYCGLLWGKARQDCPSVVDIIIDFEPRSIESLLIALKKRIKPRSKLLGILQDIDFKHLPQDNDLPSSFVVQLLEILSETTTIVLGKNKPEDRAVKEVLQERIEQEKILDRIEAQIDRNLDLKDIINITIEQVLNLIQLDRLVIYQLNVKREGRSIDTITYEARFKALELGEPIESILNFRDEVCFSRSLQCRDKYQQGFSLAIDDIQAYNNIPPCLQELLQKLQVKAKVVTPIIVHGKLWGFLIAHQCFAPRKWRSSEIDFLRQIAEYLAIAIYQSESYRQLQEQKTILEKQVKERARQLQDALVAAQSATQLKNEFLGNMSHELRTPLTCVIGLSGTLLHWSVLKEKQPSLSIEKQQQYLRTIQESGRHLLDLVNDILAFSEAEAGKTLLDIREFSLKNLARSIVQNIQPEAALKQVNLELDFRIDPKFDRFFADADRLEQILYNLIDNGIKFTPAGGRILLRVWREEKQTIFEVEDTGIGIAPQNLSFLFEKFRQLEKSRERTHGGAGLGLALTKQLIELHGGTIEVESTVGSGSIFTVYLPNEPNLKHKNHKNSDATAAASHRAKTVFLVSKDEETATLICELLTVANYQVVWSIDASISIDRVELLEPSILILDRDCSEIQVETIAETLKHLHITKQIKIIVLSSQLTAQNWQDLYDCGVDDYSLKPVHPTHLLNKIDALVQQ